MDFAIAIDTPANTTIDDPLITELPVMKGVISKWWCFFPNGHWGECRLRVRKGSESLLPRNPEGYIFGDGTIYTSNDFIYLSHAPYVVQIYSWNVDTVNDHECLLSLSVLPLYTYTPYSMQLMDMIEQEELFKVV